MVTGTASASGFASALTLPGVTVPVVVAVGYLVMDVVASTVVHSICRPKPSCCGIRHSIYNANAKPASATPTARKSNAVSGQCQCQWQCSGDDSGSASGSGKHRLVFDVVIVLKNM